MVSKTITLDAAGNSDMSVNSSAVDVDLESLFDFDQDWDPGSTEGSCTRGLIENLYNLPQPENFLRSCIFEGRYFGQMILKYCPHNFRDDLSIVLALLLEPKIDGAATDVWLGIADPKLDLSWRTLRSGDPTGTLTTTQLAEKFLENYEVRATEWIQKHLRPHCDEKPETGVVDAGVPCENTTASGCMPPPPQEEYRRHDFYCHSFKIASPRLRSHRALALWAIEQHKDVACYCGSDLRDDATFMKHAMQLAAGAGGILNQFCRSSTPQQSGKMNIP